MTTPVTPSARLSIRITPEARRTLRRAALAHGQDVTSFVLGAALDRARAVLAEDRALRLTARETTQVRANLGRDREVVAPLAALLRWGEEHRAGPEEPGP